MADLQNGGPESFTQEIRNSGLLLHTEAVHCQGVLLGSSILVSDH